MKDRMKWGIGGLVAGLAIALSVPSGAQTVSPAPGPSDRTVSVTGQATIRSAPDEAVVTLGVHTQAATAEEAMQQNAAKMTAVMKALLDQGLKQSDLATASISLYPNYSDSGLTIVGYSAENQVSATVHSMDKIGRIIDEAVSAGANLSSGISFQLSDQNQGVEQALAAAVADARAKAEALAGAGDASLGRVLQITETSSPAPPPIYYDKMAMGAAVSTPVSPPTLETQVSVSVVWELI